MWACICRGSQICAWAWLSSQWPFCKQWQSGCVCNLLLKSSECCLFYFFSSPKEDALLRGEREIFSWRLLPSIDKICYWNWLWLQFCLKSKGCFYRIRNVFFFLFFFPPICVPPGRALQLLVGFHWKVLISFVCFPRCSPLHAERILEPKWVQCMDEGRKAARGREEKVRLCFGMQLEWMMLLSGEVASGHLLHSWSLSHWPSRCSSVLSPTVCWRSIHGEGRPTTICFPRACSFISDLACLLGWSRIICPHPRANANRPSIHPADAGRGSLRAGSDNAELAFSTRSAN